MLDPPTLLGGAVEMDLSCMLFTTESSFCAFLTCFELLYTNMYIIGPSDVAVLCYMSKLEIYGETFVYGSTQT